MFGRRSRRFARYTLETSGVELGSASGRENTDMPVIAKFCGIVMRLLIDRTFGTHVHVFYGDFELVIGLSPLRVIQGDVPPWVQEWALWWVEHHQRELIPARKIDLNLATPLARQAAGQFVYAGRGGRGADS